MKKILIFSTAYLPLVGGAEIAVKEITDRLGGDFSFDLICARIKSGLAKEEQVGRIKVYRLGRGWGRIDKMLLPWRGRAMAKKLEQINKYDASWAVMASFGGLAALFFKNKFPGIPYLLTLQEGDDFKHINSRARWLGSYFKKIFSRADFITAISQYLADWAGRMGARCPVEVVPNGVSIEKFQIPNSKFQTNSKSQILNFKSKYSIKESDKIIITTSRLVKKNAVDDIIKALVELPANVKLLILGEGPDREALADLAKELKLENRVIFFGQVAHDELPPYLALADVFVRPSLSEGLGNSFLEAMAAGVPVIATPVGGIVDFLVDSETGLFCKVRDPESIALKAKIYLENKELTEKIKINAKELIMKKYDWNLLAVKMKDIFNKLIS